MFSLSRDNLRHYGNIRKRQDIYSAHIYPSMSVISFSFHVLLALGDLGALSVCPSTISSMCTEAQFLYTPRIWTRFSNIVLLSIGPVLSLNCPLPCKDPMLRPGFPFSLHLDSRAYAEVIKMRSLGPHTDLMGLNVLIGMGSREALLP